MKKSKKKFRRSSRNGFSLIELSIVLIVIGLLLAAVMKGKDLIRSAEIKKFYSNFVRQWELIYASYYDRTGKALGAPLVVSSGSNNYEYGDFVGADVADNSHDIVFRDPRRFKVQDLNQVSNNNGWIANQLIAAGIEMPKPVRGYPNIYDLSASELGKTTVIITFGSDPTSTAGITVQKYATSVNATGGAANDGHVVTDSPTSVNLGHNDDQRGNVMLIVNLPFDIAPQIDKIIDGEADGKKGNFVCVGSYQSPKDINTSTDWNEVTDILTVTGIGNYTNCYGPFNWGDGSTHKYVTAMYKLGI